MLKRLVCWWKGRHEDVNVYLPGVGSCYICLRCNRTVPRRWC